MECSHYKINVAKISKNAKAFDGGPLYRHFFKAVVRDREEFVEVFGEMQNRFPVSDGYEVTATYWEHLGYDIDENGLKG